MTGPDRLAIINADGSFANPSVELRLAAVMQEILSEYVPEPGAPGTPIVDYAQVIALVNYPTAFPPTAHAHNPTDITNSTVVGRELLTSATAVAARDTLGLDLVNNTSDANKPVSAPVQAVLNGILASSGLLIVVYSGGNYPVQAASPPTGAKIRVFTGPSAYTGPTWAGVIDGYWPNPSLT